MKNLKKIIYLFRIIPKNTRKEILFSLNLTDEKRILKNIHYSKYSNKEKIIILKDFFINFNNTKKNYFNLNFVFLFLILLFIALSIIIFINSPDIYDFGFNIASSGAIHILILMPMLWFFYEKKRINVLKEINIKKINLDDVLLLLFIVILTTFMLFMLNIIVNKNFYSIPDKNYIVYLILYPTIVPLTEELFFRRYLYRIIRFSKDPVTAALTVSVLFAAAHDIFNIITVIFTFIMSLILTVIYEIKGKLFYPVIIHCFANFLIVIFKLLLTDY